jgi:hypothetical protein
MSHEAAALTPVPEHEMLRAAFEVSGTLPDDYMMTHFGITSEEGRQYMEFGDYKGPLAEMLIEVPHPVTGKVCPVPAMLRKAHAEKGVGGVKEAFEGMKMMGATADVVIRDKTELDYVLVGATAPDPKKKLILSPEIL